MVDDNSPLIHKNTHNPQPYIHFQINSEHKTMSVMWTSVNWIASNKVLFALEKKY